MTDADEVLRRSLVRPERSQHDTVVVEASSDGFAHVARCQPALERMRNRGQLTHRQANAGTRLYEDWAIGVMLARNPDAGGTTIHDPGGYRDKQLDAATRYRRAREAIGGRMWPCLFHVSCLDWSVERFANECGNGMDRKQWMGILKVSLDTLADFYGM